MNLTVESWKLKVWRGYSSEGNAKIQMKPEGGYSGRKETENRYREVALIHTACTKNPRSQAWQSDIQLRWRKLSEIDWKTKNIYELSTVCVGFRRSTHDWLVPNSKAGPRV